MIYIDDIEMIIIPKTKNSDASKMRVLDGMNKVVYDIDVENLEHCYTAQVDDMDVLKDGQYRYEIYDGVSVYEIGLLQKGRFSPVDTSIYDKKTEFVIYEG